MMSDAQMHCGIQSEQVRSEQIGPRPHVSSELCGSKTQQQHFLPVRVCPCVSVCVCVC